MKNFLVLSLLISAFASAAMASSFSPKVIYGDDDRIDVYEETNENLVKLSASTAAMVPNGNLNRISDYEIELGGRSLEDRGICGTERFAKQPSAANCSGFLVGKNKLVTAGHCMRNQSACNGSVWVFDYKVDYADQAKVVVDTSNVYKCKRIISQTLDSSTKDDYALIELERDAEDREPLKFRTEGAPKKGDNIVVIGHPSGLPTKIAGGAAIRSVNSVYFQANLDTYGGNSGSAVFNADTGLIEGILVRGERDYVRDSARGCQVSNVIANNGGRGEDVTRITNIKELMPSSGTGAGSDDGSSDDGSGDDSDEDPYADLPDWLRWILGLPRRS